MSSQSQAAAGGILPMPTAVLQKPTVAGNAPQTGKANAPRLKLVLRRLAPGLTQAEFETALGEEWKLGAGKVDWFVYKPGKVSKDPAKPSRPARAYLHLISQAHLPALSDKVRATSFLDAKNTSKHPVLIGPPSLEFATYARISNGKKRNDARQGLIDQDSEFKAFLESLTNAPTRPSPPESETEALAKDIKTTPLIEAIREKKAAKEKAAKEKAARAKESGKQAKDDKGGPKGKADKPTIKGGKDAAAGADKGKKPGKPEKTEKPAKEAGKATSKDAATGAKAKDGGASTAQASGEKRRERGNASIAKQMLARDLGLAPASAGRRGKKDPATGAADSTVKSGDDTAAAKDSGTIAAKPSTTVSSTDKSTGKRDGKPTRAERRANKGSQEAKAAETGGASPTASNPTILKKGSSDTAAKSSTSAASTAPPTGPATTRAPTRPVPSTNSNTNTSPAPPNRHAFIKHANASQGITEALLRTALAAHGTVETVEIDKRKGFAYAAFASPEGLRAAMKASPVSVGEGAVVVLEKREAGQSGRGQQGGGGQGRTAGGAGGGSAARGRGPKGAGGRGGKGAAAATPTAASAGASVAPLGSAPAQASGEPSGS